MVEQSKSENGLQNELERLRRRIRELERSEDVRKRVQSAFQGLEYRWRLLVEGLPDIILTISSDGTVLAVNHPPEGYGHEDILGGVVYAVVMPDYHDSLREEVAGAFREGRSGICELRCRDAAGSPATWYSVRIVPVRRDNQVIAATLVLSDLSEHKRMAGQLRAKDLLIDASVSGMAILDLDGKLTYVNPAFERLWHFKSRDEAIGRHIGELWLDRRSALNVWRAVKREGTWSGEMVARRADRSEFTAQFVANVIRDESEQWIGVGASAVDVTAAREAERESQKQERLDSLSMLASGAAHAFNNLLGGIYGYIDMARQYGNPGDTLRDYLDNAFAVYEKARTLTQQLLIFSRGDRPNLEQVSVTDAIGDSLSAALTGSQVKGVTHCSSDLWKVEADRAQVAQALSNVIANAAQAAPEADSIEVKAENVEFLAPPAPPLHEGRYVMVTVKDSGPGIPQEYQSRIFDPFFSTREHGTGLGLTIAHAIIGRHGGHIAVDSRSGLGTSVTVFIPAAAHTGSRRTRKRARQLKGGAKVLIMDDEEFIRGMTERVLKRLGYEVAVARDGEEAVRLYRSAVDLNEPFAVVILDLTVAHGGMGGKQALKEIRKLNPSVKAVVSSGYSDEPVMKNPARFGFRAGLPKPYRIEQVRDILLELVEEEEAPDA